MRWIILLLVITLFAYGCGRASDCKDHNYWECPKECVVCPPCEVCSSISCQTEEACRAIGFNRSWYEGIKERLNSSIS